MRRILVGVVMTAMLAGVAYADLQNVTVGGQLEMRWRWYHDAFESGTTLAKPQAHVRIPASWIPGRVTGQDGVLSMMRYDRSGNDWHFAEQATSLNFRADFTDNVSAFIEFYSFDNWGEDFRSNYLTGIDSRAETSNDVELLQGYIDINKVFDQSLRLRVGRQVMQFGNERDCFMISGKTSPTNRYSFDGVRATYTGVDKLTIDAWWMKLAELSPAEEDGDTDFYGVYGTYAFSDAAKLSAYWLFLRDAHSVNDTKWDDDLSETIEGWLDKDDYPVTTIHTLGVQFQGKSNGFDYNAQVAYQFGKAGTLGYLFQKPWWYSTYGDDDAEYDNWGMEATLGYTTDTAWKIRPYLQGVCFQGEDNRDVSFSDWLNPLGTDPKASVSFNRMFSDTNYCPVLNDNADMTNFWQVGGGVTMSPTEKIGVTLRAYNTFTYDTFDWPAYVDVPHSDAFPSGRMPVAPWFSFLTKKSSNNLGFSLDTILKYSYSKDLTFVFYYGHLFAGDGVRDGAYVSYYGTMMNGGTDKKDADYMFLWAILKF